MEVVRGIGQLSRPLSHAVVTIGNFDGVHLGHRHIIRRALEKARARGGACVVYTFRPHPQIALHPEGAVQLLLTYDEKLEILASLGVDLVIEEPFSREFSVVDPDQFFHDVLLHRLSAEAIVVGYDFSFGKGRRGHIPALTSFCEQAGVELEVVPPQRLDGEIISSSHVRDHLSAGEVHNAAELLGMPFFYRGIVVRGEGRGRQLGFPTANLRLESKLALPYGVYATWATCDAQRYLSVTNVGVRPTFRSPQGHELQALIETHLIGADIDLYGKTLQVDFIDRLRSEKRFNSAEELKGQIRLDLLQAQDALTKIVTPPTIRT